MVGEENCLLNPLTPLPPPPPSPSQSDKHTHIHVLMGKKVKEYILKSNPQI